MAPLDRPGVSCTACHAGNPVNSGGGSVRIVFPGALTYTPGQAQNLSVMVSDTTAAIFGFQLTARLDRSPSTSQAGTFDVGDGQRVICSNNQVRPAGGCGGNGIEWIEHSAPSLSGVFAVRWTPPAAASGPVHLYVSANAANGDDTPRGDKIYAAEYVLVPASTATTGVPTIQSIGGAAGGTAGAIQSGSWITISGANFATAATTWDSSIVGGVFPTTVGDVTVTINSKPAPISFVNQSQINALAPPDLAIGPVNVVVSNATGSSAPASVNLATANPGFFTFNSKYIAGVVLDSGTASELLAPAGSLGAGVQSRAAHAGDTILLFGTGWGRSTAPLSTAMATSVAIPISHTGSDNTAPVATVTIGGQPAQFSFIGMVSPGVCQLNVVVPQVAAGDQQVVLTLLNGGALPGPLFIPVQ
jgi:uncharacterized protein (TIGR03437 family)